MIENKLSMEQSHFCKRDRLEIYDIKHAQLITMDHSTTSQSNDTTIVLCGNCKLFFAC
jgi:hypothetical protein